jgi:hypothetical protein
MIIKEPTVAEIKAYRIEHSTGLPDARRALIRKAVEDALVRAETLSDLKEVIQFLLRLI